MLWNSCSIGYHEIRDHHASTSTWNSTFTSSIISGCAETPEDGHYCREAGQYIPKTNIVNLFSFGWRPWPVYLQLRSEHPENSRHLQFQGRLALLEGISKELAYNFLVLPHHLLLWLFLGLAEKRFSLLRSHDSLEFVTKKDTSLTKCANEVLKQFLKSVTRVKRTTYRPYI